MRSPEDMKIIEIDITNACIHNCSNCTRMCGHHKNPYFMSWETFKRAVDSMEGYDGGVSMMGGEPTLHPEFERFAEYLGDKYKDTPKKDNYFLKPTRFFIRDRKLEERNRTYSYIEKTGDNVIGQRVKGPVLFSSLASNYYKYYEIIQDVFCYQGINDHLIPCYHQPIGVTRKDMGIPDSEWPILRDACWIQNSWSASITPKGCFFCEVAGVLDMLFDGPGGWPIEKGWWKRKPEDFKDQIHWCELCGAALNTRSRNANDEIDDVSPSFYRRLKQIDSPKLKRGQVNIYQINVDDIKDEENRKADYHKTNLNRVGEGNRTIYPQKLWGGLICSEHDSIDKVVECIEHNIKQVTGLYCFAHKTLYDELKIRLERYSNVYMVASDESLGVNLAKLCEYVGDLQYIVCFTIGIKLSDSFFDRISKYAVNPGVMHYRMKRGNGILGDSWLILNTENDVFMLFNTKAKALRKAGFDGIAKMRDYNSFINLWDINKTFIFDDKLMEDRQLINELSYSKGLRYIIFGTGTYGKKAYKEILSIGGTVVFFIDSNDKKWGQRIIDDLMVFSPDELSRRKGDYDKVVIASISYNDMRKKILENELTDKDIVAPVF